MSARLLSGKAGWPKVVLARAGAYDPDAGLAAAEAAGAWRAWRSAVADLGPDAVTRLVDEAGLRGRGGGGYPTAAKWRICNAQPSAVRYAVANGYEADPGAATDRTLLELDPHGVLEGLALAAFAVGASQAYLAVRADAAVAVRRLTSAIREAEEAGLIGSDALGSGIDVHIELRPLQGAFVLGEETVLLRALEGKRGMPEQRPPYPAVKGLWGQPTIVNNVATLAAVPWIVSHGAAEFRAIGDAEGPGTVLVHVTGAVKEPGVLEVPTGTSLRAIVAAAGGPNGKLKAMLVGGPSGGFLPPDARDTAYAHEALGKAGAIVGSGAVLVVDESACIVELATLMERFMSEESCGKCVPCRIGTRRLTEIGERFTGGRPRPNDVQLLGDLALDVRDGSLCGHGITAPNPLVSGLRYFAAEFDAHINDSTCPAGVCTPLRVASGVA
ncbi:MAG: NADH-ubiquinone oxidoreductase-F iron-sulfur binding region domain-containing protein [Candidatus Limnocylindrales bacterium]